MFDVVHDFEIAPLTALARQAWEPLTSDHLHLLLKDVRAGFERWKQSLVDHQGNITAVTGKGLLSDWSLGPRPLQAEKVTPVGAGGVTVSNEIDLAFKLWVEREPNFTSLIDDFGLTRIFAALMLANDNAQNFKSLVRAHALLAQLMLTSKSGDDAAIKYLIEEAVKYEAKAAKFSKPRPRGSIDDLGKLLLSLLQQQPQMSNAAAWEELNNQVDSVVQEVDDEKIYYKSRGKERTVSRKGFEGRMTRLRKLLK